MSLRLNLAFSLSKESETRGTFVALFFSALHGREHMRSARLIPLLLAGRG